MPRRRKPPSQNWRVFLDNHVGELMSIDFFTVPTATFRVLFVLIEDALGLGQGRAGASFGAAAREGKGDRDPGSRRSSPPVRETRGVVPLVPRRGLTISIP